MASLRLAPSFNGPILSVEGISSTIDTDSHFAEPTPDAVTDDESCPGLAEIQVCAIDFFSLNSNICPSILADVQTFGCHCQI